MVGRWHVIIHLYTTYRLIVLAEPVGWKMLPTSHHLGEPETTIELFFFLDFLWITKTWLITVPDEWFRIKRVRIRGMYMYLYIYILGVAPNIYIYHYHYDYWYNYYCHYYHYFLSLLYIQVQVFDMKGSSTRIGPLQNAYLNIPYSKRINHLINTHLNKPSNIFGHQQRLTTWSLRHGPVRSFMRN